MKLKACIYIFVSFICISGLFSQTQNADSLYSRPLIEVLNNLEHQFGIKIKYDQKMIDGKVLTYADWRIKPWSVTETLKAVLAPFDYIYTMDNGKYKIKSFEYARTTTEEGKQFLDYLNLLYPNKTDWEQRKAQLKACLPSALGLSPMPTKPSTQIILTKIRKYNGYTVQNFALETLPGIYVCGSIYKSSLKMKQYPIILNPNGHFGQGRYRADQQNRCAMQARMGAIAVSWDLFAWGESLLQFDGTLHRLSAAHAIQTLNTLRILDYMLSLKEADQTKVGITGGSGGGSMTMMVSAIDDRITLSIPTVMTSSYFVGGCPCESGLPAHLCGNRTNNAELSAMFAPKPQLILSDGKDWTANVPELELPYIKRIYGFYGAEENIENTHFPEEGHDYGISKRLAMYRFIAKHFNLDLKSISDSDGNIDESKVTIEKESEMYAFGEKGENLPKNAIKGKESLLKVLKEYQIIKE